MQQQDLFDTLEVNRHDAYAFGCNLLSTGTGFVVHDTAKQFIRDARKLGLSPYPVSNIEIAKGGGGVHCIENALDNTTPDYLAAHGPVTLKTT